MILSQENSADADFEQKVIKSFSRHVKTYDRNAQLQRSMAERLATLIPNPFPQKILEIGCGTGMFTRHLLARDPSSLILNDIAPPMIEYLRSHLNLPAKTKFLAGNAESVTIPKVKLIAGNAVFQWFQHPEVTLKRLYASLDQKGYLAFSTFGPKTLEEFRSTAHIEGPTHLLSQKRWKTLLTQSGFNLISFESESRQIFFPDTRGLMKNLQQIGAAPMPVLNAGKLKQLMQEYDQKYASPQGVYTNWELYYFFAGKGTS